MLTQRRQGKAPACRRQPAPLSAIRAEGAARGTVRSCRFRQARRARRLTLLTGFFALAVCLAKILPMRPADDESKVTA